MVVVVVVVVVREGQPRTLRITSPESCAVEPGSRLTKTYSTSGSDEFSAGADGPRAASNDSAESSVPIMSLVRHGAKS